MSEVEVQNKETTAEKEIMKKKEIVEDAKNESKESKDVEEKPTNGVHSSSEEESKSKDEKKEEKDTSLSSKEEHSDKEEEEEKENSAEVSKNDESKDEDSEAMDESVEDSKVDDSVNDSKDESMDVSKDDSFEEKTPRKGLLEQDVEVKGKRERKKVERFVQEPKKEEVEVEGTGMALKEIPYIQNMIMKTGPEDLKFLHRLAYGRPGTANEIRKNLYKFKGFAFTKDDKAYERKKTSMEKIVLGELKKILGVLGLEKSGVKSAIVERLIAFLLEPFDAGKELPSKRRRSSQGKKRGTNKKKKDKSSTKESQSAESGSESDEEKSDAEAEDEEEQEQEEEPEKEKEEEPESANENESEEEEEEEEEPVKKPKKKATKAAAVKKTPQPKKTPKPRAKTPKAPKTPKTPKTPKSQPKKRPIESEPEDSDSNDSDNEPIQKKAKKSPTDQEIETFIKKLLNKADLNEVTMKKLCQQVYDNYPDQDLSHKKDFIKSTVKAIL